MFDEEQAYCYAMVRLRAAATEYTHSMKDAVRATGTEAHEEAVARWDAARGEYYVAMAEADEAFDAFFATL